MASDGHLASLLQHEGITLRLIPGHADGAGGLAPIVGFYRYQAAILALAVAFLAAWVVLILFWPRYSQWTAPQVALMGVVLMLTVLDFARRAVWTGASDDCGPAFRPTSWEHGGIPVLARVTGLWRNTISRAPLPGEIVLDEVDRYSAHSSPLPGISHPKTLVIVDGCLLTETDYSCSGGLDGLTPQSAVPTISRANFTDPLDLVVRLRPAATAWGPGEAATRHRRL
jgi:hypothetical protein